MERKKSAIKKNSIQKSQKKKKSNFHLSFIDDLLVLLNNFFRQLRNIHQLSEIIQQLLFVTPKDHNFLRNKTRQNGFNHFVYEIAESPQAIHNQFILSIRKQLISFIRNLLGYRIIKILPCKEAIIRQQNKLINISFRIILYEQLQHVQRIIQIPILILNSFLVDIMRPYQQDYSSFVIFADDFVDLKLWDAYLVLFVVLEAGLGVFLPHCFVPLEVVLNALQALFVVVLSVFEEPADQILERIVGELGAVAVALDVVFVNCCFQLIVDCDLLRGNLVLSFEREMSDFLLLLCLFEFQFQFLCKVLLDQFCSIFYVKQKIFVNWFLFTINNVINDTQTERIHFWNSQNGLQINYSHFLPILLYRFYSIFLNTLNKSINTQIHDGFYSLFLEIKQIQYYSFYLLFVTLISLLDF